MVENGNDPEMREAIGENIVAIAKRRAILDDLRKLLPPGAAAAQPTQHVPAATLALSPAPAPAPAPVLPLDEDTGGVYL